MCGSGPKIPDPTPAMMEQIRSTERIRMRAMDISERMLDYNQERQTRLDQLNEEVQRRQLGMAEELHREALDIFDYQKRVFRPIEESLAAEAMRESTPVYYEQYAQEAMARQASAFQNAQDQVTRQMQAMGINPSSGSYQANQRQLQLANAAGMGAVANEARDRAKALSWAKRADVAGLGQGLAGAGLGAYQVAIGANQSVIDSATKVDEQATRALGTPMDYERMALQAAQSGLQAHADIYRTQMQGAIAAASHNDGLFGALGTGLGLWAGGGFQI